MLRTKRMTQPTKQNTHRLTGTETFSFFLGLGGGLLVGGVQVFSRVQTSRTHSILLRRANASYNRPVVVVVAEGMELVGPD